MPSVMQMTSLHRRRPLAMASAAPAGGTKMQEVSRRELHRLLDGV